VVALLQVWLTVAGLNGSPEKATRFLSLYLLPPLGCWHYASLGFAAGAI
jgi:hypothetical protein